MSDTVLRVVGIVVVLAIIYCGLLEYRARKRWGRNLPSDIDRER